MKNTLRILQKDEQGFTLVELAVVMVIIGVLVGGILKGQELIQNARVTSTISGINSYSAAMADFQNQYNALPGDMANGNTRLNSCGGANTNVTCATPAGATAGNGIIEQAVGAQVANNEASAFFGQLLAANYISGLTGANVVNIGDMLPPTPLGGAYHVGNYVPNNANVGFVIGTQRAGLYLTIIQNLAGTAAGAVGPVSGTQAGRIDTKLDDGRPLSGSMLGSNAAPCTVGAAPAVVYDGAANSTCNLAYRL